MKPIVTIVLPTFNREKFLPQAFAAIAAQTFASWELIVVDDGSTDGTRNVVAKLIAESKQPARYIYQENKGASGARNTGLEQATGEYIAFYDSDDLWLPHHLQDCVNALAVNPDVDWVYSATRVVDFATGEVLLNNVFYEDGRPRQFLQLDGTEVRSTVNVLKSSEAMIIALRDCLFAGFQTSLLRRTVFDSLRLPDFRVGEDQVFTVIAMKSGFRLAFINDVHVEYRLHAGGVSAGFAGDKTHTLRACEEFLRAFEWIGREVQLCRTERTTLRDRLSRECFWNVGYRMQQMGMHREAQEMFRKGISYKPWNLPLWKTFAISFLKQRASFQKQ